ncbi:unnamed protein product [Callosobruchus maculatus]|uniref:Translational activator of cytochrome c oxidase 1 n=1 Tax=Callosobruchus maculatus TaxID=64391 RepID=A0A653D8S3_CALMS|nr:unnamed protein product [Callosobruchus maculatus]
MLKLQFGLFRQLQRNRFNKYLIKRYAGHSKWQNIRHIKGIKDAQKNLLFTRISRMINVAVQEGGSADPNKNLKLSQIVDQAKKSNMPVASIQNILKSCKIDKSKAIRDVFDIKGPGGCFILCEVFTHQPHQFKNNLATILRKHKSQYANGGGHHIFQEKGVIITELQSEISKEEEMLELATSHAIESGAEDVTILDKSTAKFLCEISTMQKVIEALEKQGYTIVSATEEWIAVQLHQLAEPDLTVVDALYKKLEALPEVVRIADNIA